MNILKPASRHPLQNGNSVIIQHATLNEAPLIVEMHERSSEQTRYKRYGHFFDYQMKHFEEWLALPPSEGIMIVAVDDTAQKQIIGMAQYVVEYDKGVKIAEPGIMVEDRFQGQGLGWILARELGRTAQVNGIEHFHTFINGSNDAAMHLVTKVI